MTRTTTRTTPSLLFLLPLTMLLMAAGQQDEPKAGVRRALIICGHPGDDEHRKQFAATVESLAKSLVEHLQFDPAAVWVLFGGEEVQAGAQLHFAADAERVHALVARRGR